MRVLGKVVILGAVIVAGMQLIRPSIPSAPPSAEVQVPPHIRQILRKDCYSCHSSERRLSWFDELAPGYWLVRHDVLTAREHLNFSTLGAKPAPAQKAALYEAVNMIQLGAMPLPQYRALHPEARVSPEELSALKAYLGPWTPAPVQAGDVKATAGAKTDAPPAAVPAHEQPLSNLAEVPPEFNGYPFDPSFEHWKLISITDRGDNNTFRFVLGNDVAVRAVAAGSINPWPDGARLAKIAWQQEPGPDGLMHPGKFVQVELMTKNASAYKRTEGWGWGRWRGLDLKPYGRNASFVNECTGCHQPMKGDDFIFTLPISKAEVSGAEVVNVHAASLPAGLPFQPLGWRPVTMYVDPKAHTMSLLLANGEAAGEISARSGEGPVPAQYTPGSVLALVTWVQRDDPHWFGGRIPDSPQSVEFVDTSPSPAQVRYRRFQGAGLREENSGSQERSRFILGLSPARMP